MTASRTASMGTFHRSRRLTAPISAPHLAEQVNHNPFLAQQVADCAAEHGRIPNFVTVDFYDIGDVLSVVEDLNAPR